MSQTEGFKGHQPLRLKVEKFFRRDTEREQPEREKGLSTEAAKETEKRMFLIFLVPDTW